MLNEISWTLAKKVAKTVATSALEGISFVGDKVAEYSDEAKEFIEDLDKKDISGREARQAKRNKED